MCSQRRGAEGGEGQGAFQAPLVIQSLSLESLRCGCRVGEGAQRHHSRLSWEPLRPCGQRPKPYSHQGCLCLPSVSPREI